MKRRAFLASFAAAAALPRASWADAGSPAYLAAAKEVSGDYSLSGISRAGERLFSLPLPSRGHAATAHPTRPEAVAFARRPGTFALVIDCATGVTTARLTPPEGRQFNGHGAYSADGATLYTSEVVAEGSEGRIGLWDAARGYQRIGEFASNGIGPHEIRRLPGSDDLVVANGGIQTDPSDRTPLNLDTMRPNLSYLSPEGAVLEVVDLPELWQNSIRHLALRSDGQVAFAMQWQGDLAEPVPLLGLHRRGGDVTLAEPVEAEMFAMKGYAGSVAYTQDGQQVAITSPKGGRIQAFSATGVPLWSLARADVCGLGPCAEGGFVATDGQGLVARVIDGRLEPLSSARVSWDNHLVALG
ncbi:DUF1513 domain-containing protein [Sedimentimonas flavescens]|uniref:DUF1513 domain-containing protein n=1 Tax=Sedimentimonas flavescens TaxID=2851012 RepID=UPI0021A35239|nr:DUF1513 domain-containing protein [Sedimentimonas flavescens]MCT2539118.1 DUF1513 domain-containing protein [Sedimentimonas flavescens]